jgi:hypothetical protein
MRGATAIGTIARADRASWIVTTTAAGVRDGRLCRGVFAAKYVVHDNGSRPFMVGYDKTHVSVFKLIQGSRRRSSVIALEISVGDVLRARC